MASKSTVPYNSDACDVVVLGAGVHAAAVARQLAASRRSVVVVSPSTDKRAPGPTRAPVFSVDAHGTSLLTSLHATAAPLLRSLEQELGADLLVPTGALSLAPQAWLSDALDVACAEAGVYMQPLTRGALATRFPCFYIPELWEGRLSADAGTLFLDALHAALYFKCGRAGVSLMGGLDVVECEDRGGSWRCVLASKDGMQRRLECEQLVLAPETAPEARVCLDKLQLPLNLPVRS